LKTPVARYIQKLADETERLNARDSIRQREIENLRTIVKKRTKRKKGKRVALKGHFHISTPELRDAVVIAEEETASRAKGKGGKVKNASYELDSEMKVEEEVGDESESEIEDCIVVDVG
jgi:hypothetical protein